MLLCCLGIDFQMKTLTVNSVITTLQLWDTAGQERSERCIKLCSSTLNKLVLFSKMSFTRYRSITEQYYRKVDAILAVYDITDSLSFTAVRGWMDSVKVSCWRFSKCLHAKTCKTLVWIYMLITRGKVESQQPLEAFYMFTLKPLLFLFMSKIFIQFGPQCSACIKSLNYWCFYPRRRWVTVRC